MTTAKNEGLLGYNMKVIIYCGRGINLWWGYKNLDGVRSLLGGIQREFPPSMPSKENPDFTVLRQGQVADKHDSS